MSEKKSNRKPARKKKKGWIKLPRWLKKKKGRASGRPLPLRILRAGVIAGIWGFIFLLLLTAWYAKDLPRLIDSPQFERHASIVIYGADGSQIGRYGEMKGLSVKVSELPPHLIYAVLATEDRRFYQHHGVDPVGIARAMAANLLHRRVLQGGSTITQQLAKNLFLSRERTLKRKIQEAMLAIWLERSLTKDEILSAYLNRVYLGSGAYGVDAAARIYFDKSAREVNLRESAILAGLLKAPSRYAPDSNPGLAAQRAKVVLSAMADAGYITKKEADAATLKTPHPERKPGDGDGVHYYTDWISAELDKMVGTGDKDLVVRTTLDPDIQKRAEAILAAALQESGEKLNVTQGALIVLDYDGAIRAMVGGRNYNASQFNRVTQSLRPPGSSFKPVVYLTALEQGWHPDDMINDAPLRIGRYRPQNYKNEYLGEVPLHTALTLSLNTAAVRLLQSTGVPAAIDTARRLGIHAALPHDLSLALGSGGVPMIEMAAAYATIGNGGAQVQPYGVTEITESSGRLLYRRSNVIVSGKRVFNPQAIGNLTHMMQEVVDEGTGRRAALPYRAAGKTGTSQDSRDAWFIGFTDQFVAAVWVGNDDNSPMKGVTGGSLPAGIWRDVMMAAHEKGGAFAPRFPSSPDTMANDSAGDSFGGLIGRIIRTFNE